LVNVEECQRFDKFDDQALREFGSPHDRASVDNQNALASSTFSRVRWLYPGLQNRRQLDLAYVRM
jgi:hypothetical protein